MEDGGENLEISEADAKPDEEKDVNYPVSMDFTADSNNKITSISGLHIQDSNGSPGFDSESEEDDENEEFHLSVSQVKEKIAREITSVEDVLGIKLPGDENGIQDSDENRSPHKVTDKELNSSELPVENSQHLSPMTSDILLHTRPDSPPCDDGLDADKMGVDLVESDQESENNGASSELVLQPASALEPISPSETRTGVTNILHKDEFSEVDKSESFSESRLLKAGEHEANNELDRIESEDINRVDDNESQDHCKWDENLSPESRLCPNGESMSSDSVVLNSRHDCDLSGISSSPVNRICEFDKECLNDSSSNQICDSVETLEDQIKGRDNGMCVDRENLNLSVETENVEASLEEIRREENVSDVEGINECDRDEEDDIVSADVLPDVRSTSLDVENQCNGDIDFHEDSNQDNEGWCDTMDTSAVVEESQGGEECSETSVSLEGKRKQTFDDETGENSTSASVESRSSTKMFKIDHNAHLSQQNSVKAPCISNQPLDGRAFFPGNSHLSEYAQYLGLQPTVKFKCVRCGEKSFSSMMDLKTHQYACLKSHAPSQPNPTPASFTPVQTSSTNFRITRKVYLCSVCGTYYENWNLFLHMREVHKRHICLFCLGMFSQAERLAAHLVAKHNISEGHYGSAEDFRLSCKGSVFLMCCSCEKVFSEEDSFTNHPCKDRNSAVRPNLSNSLVSVKNQCNSLSSKSTLPKQTLKQSGESLGRAVIPKSSENKAGKSNSKGTSNDNASGKGNSGRPKQILKVKIPIQPKKQETPLPSKSTSTSLHRTIQQPPAVNYPSSNLEPIHTSLVNTHSHPENLPKLDELSGRFSSPQLGQDSNLMSNLDKTINAVALGMTSDAIAWHRSNEDVPMNEPAQLPCLDGAAKSDTESDEQSVQNFGGEEIVNEVPNSESLPENVNEAEAEKADDLSPALIPETETTRSDHEVIEQPPTLELSSNVQPDIEEPTGLAPSSPPTILQEPVFTASESPVPPAETPPLPEQTPAEESDPDTDDSDKLSLVVDETGSVGENEDKTVVPGEVVEPQEVPSEPPSLTAATDVLHSHEPVASEPNLEKGIDLQLAGEDVPVTEVTIEEPLEDIPIQALLKECVKALCHVCVYCSHARRIAVNGKQLALHTLAEHRFSPIDGGDKQDPSPIVRFTLRLKDSVQVLQDMFFNTDSYDSTDKSSCLPYDRTYECFQCHFFLRSHKELYIHNRKMHQKTILLCIMCKSNFYSYSELLCHLCPGIYIPQCNIGFHCCMCEVDNLPSAFRLMVHLRKKHHACDVCLEITDDQQKLSSHVWKHKLHHLCYRCGIAYRNKPDITNHLFWKHGTESVLCKKCLQKKWPHVYHFCVPPATFTCDECNSLFTRAVSLRVHKRLHTGEQPHHCTECEEKFISKKLLAKHEQSHRTPVPEENVPEVSEGTEGRTENRSDEVTDSLVASGSTSVEAQKDDTREKEESSDIEKDGEKDKKHSSKKKKHREKEEQKKKVVDVYDLPPLNLSSESDSSDDEGKKEQPPVTVPTLPEPAAPAPEPVDEPTEPAQVVDGIWDNFQNYKASLEKAEAAGKNPTPEEPAEDPLKELRQIISMDHDYCLPPDASKPSEPAQEEEKKPEAEVTEVPPVEVEPSEKEQPENALVEENPSLTPPRKDDAKSIMSSESPTKKKRSPKKKTKRRSSSSSSNSSSGSDSSSCSCGSNCSCSSSSSDSSSSSSDSDSSSSESRRRSQARRELRKERALGKKKDEEAAAVPVPPGPQPEEPHIDVMEAEPAFRESDLDTTETDTDEDFYDERPQKPPDESQVEKRNLLLLASVAPLNNGSVSPTLIPPQQEVPMDASQQPQFAVPQLNPAAVSGGKKRTKKRKKNQASRYHPKLTLTRPLPDIPVQANVSPHGQSDGLSTERFTPLYYPLSAPSPVSPVVQRHPVTPSFQQSTPELNSKKPLVTKLTREIIPNASSGSETEGRTKRKRMPNKFYGYSSDEDAEDHVHSAQKWRKTESTVSQPPPPPPPVMPTPPRIPVSPLTLKRTVPSVQDTPRPPQVPPLTLNKSLVTKADSDSEESKRITSSSSSTDSDDDAMQISEMPTPAHPIPTPGGDGPGRETNDNLYCYCQCPYDEVSEMIACDGKNCAIEWFHFECVGIMVPPKGQWYCPDCRKHMTNYQGSE